MIMEFKSLTMYTIFKNLRRYLPNKKTSPNFAAGEVTGLND